MNTSVPLSNDLWLISDTHFGHKNIITYQDRPETHESIMLAEWIRHVADDDPILHLGDVWFKTNNDWADILSRMPGKKYLILGNHDRQRRGVRELAH